MVLRAIMRKDLQQKWLTGLLFAVIHLALFLAVVARDMDFNLMKVIKAH